MGDIVEETFAGVLIQFKRCRLSLDDSKPIDRKKIEFLDNNVSGELNMPKGYWDITGMIGRTQTNIQTTRGGVDSKSRKGAIGSPPLLSKARPQPRCKGKNKDGSQCGRLAAKGSDLCGPCQKKESANAISGDSDASSDIAE